MTVTYCHLEAPAETFHARAAMVAATIRSLGIDQCAGCKAGFIAAVMAELARQDASHE